MFKRNCRIACCSSILLLLFFACQPVSKEQSVQKEQIISPPPSKQLNVLTTRFYGADEALFKSFEDLYKLKVNVIKGSSSDLLAQSGPDGQAGDVLILEDIGSILEAKSLGYLSPFSSEQLKNYVADLYKDKEFYWFALGKKAMAFVYNKNVKGDELKSYESITRKKWKGKLLLPASNAMIENMLAMMIAEEGPDFTAKWLRNMMQNAAREPQGDDFDQINALDAGKGDVAFISASALLQFTNSGNPDFFKIGEKLGVVYPENSKNKTYFDLTAVGILEKTAYPSESTAFLDYLMHKSSQPEYCSVVHEYPINIMAIPNDFLINIGGFTPSETDISLCGEHRPKAIELLEKAGWK